ncbi:MAG: DUF819 family protein, partial [Myxococcota bacterium]
TVAVSTSSRSRRAPPKTSSPCTATVVSALRGFEGALALAVLAVTTVAVHGLLVFGGARLLRLDVETATVASQANVGGGTTALALARTLGRPDLAVPGILVGSLGTALGTFVGFFVASTLGS